MTSLWLESWWESSPAKVFRLVKYCNFMQVPSDEWTDDHPSIWCHVLYPFALPRHGVNIQHEPDVYRKLSLASDWSRFAADHKQEKRSGCVSPKGFYAWSWSYLCYILVRYIYIYTYIHIIYNCRCFSKRQSAAHCLACLELDGSLLLSCYLSH